MEKKGEIFTLRIKGSKKARWAMGILNAKIMRMPNYVALNSIIEAF